MMSHYIILSKIDYRLNAIMLLLVVLMVHIYSLIFFSQHMHYAIFVLFKEFINLLVHLTDELFTIAQKFSIVHNTIDIFHN